MRQARDLCRRAMAPFQGVWVEDKGAVFVVHYREAGPASVRRGGAAIRRIVAGFAPELRLLGGKKIWEVFPREVKGKGAAIRDIARSQPAGTLVLFLGDDATDEQAFRALPRAVTVRVGRRARTRAKYRLESPAQVREFLERMAGLL